MKRCPQCGLTNIEQRQTCKQCGAPLSDQALLPTVSSRQLISLKYLWPVIILALFAVAAPRALDWQISSDLRDPNKVPPGPRGSMILRLRTPADQLPIRDLELYNDGSIWSGTIDEMYFSDNREAAVHSTRLDHELLQEVLHFQSAWCRRDATVYRPTASTPAYGLSIWCDGHIDSAHIAASKLPRALGDVVTIVFHQ
jgi:hypothetical protein